MINNQEMYEFRKDTIMVIKNGICTIAAGGLIDYFFGEGYKELYDPIMFAGLMLLTGGTIEYTLPNIANSIEHVIHNVRNKVKVLEDEVNKID